MGNYLSDSLKKGSELWQAVRLIRSDNWQNVMTGFGTTRDKTTYGRFYGKRRITDTELSNLYHQSDVAKRAIALKPQEMVRQGWAVGIEDDEGDIATALVKKLREIGAATHIRDAMIWARLYGGSGIIIGADDGFEAELPLNETSITAVNFLHVIDRRHMMPEAPIEDTMDPNFGKPEFYRINPTDGRGGFRIHHSRLILFGGAHTDPEERQRLGGWDHSVIEAMYDTLRQFASVWQASEQLMSDASQAVFKIQGLMSMIAGGQKEDLQTRMQLVDMSRSVARALLLDADGGEEFTRQSSSFTDASVMLDKFMMRLAAATDIPVTILMGRSPAGQNATGDADFRWFYDNVRTAQENDLRPCLERLIEIIFASREGPTGGNVPAEWELRFNPLWQMTPAEQAELQNKQADTDTKYIQSGVLLPEEAALSRFKTEGWSSDTQIDRDLRDQMLNAPEESELEEPAPEPEEDEVVLGPADAAVVLTVNEARAAQGLAPWPNTEEGAMTVLEFKKLKEKGPEGPEEEETSELPIPPMMVPNNEEEAEPSEESCDDAAATESGSLVDVESDDEETE